MNTEKANLSLESIPANRRLVDELSAHKLISPEARQFALDFLYPAKNWGLWASRLLLVLGVSLVLSGIIYFFAFNWNKIPQAIKLGSVQLAILLCLGASYFYKIQKLPGKLLLLSASVLVGAFLAVFGQIYQTGADAYTLFMVWALLILPWTLIAEFAALWLIWLVVTNIFLVLYWDQAAQPEAPMQFMIFFYLALFNASFLALREYFAARQVQSLMERWTRLILIIPILAYALIPALAYIIEPGQATPSITYGALLAGIIHVTFSIIYRYWLPDILVLAATILSACIVLETAMFKGIMDAFNHGDAPGYLLMGVFTLGLFTGAIIILRSIATKMEAKHV